MQGGQKAQVVAVACDDAHRFAKPCRDVIRLIEGLGVEGDAHLGVTVQHRSRVAKDPNQPNLGQVHLIHAELFDELTAAGFAVAPGRIGENVTLRGLALLDLPAGTRLGLGGEAEVMLMAAVLGRAADGSLVRKAGVMAVVTSGGLVRPGDCVEVRLPTAPYRRLKPV
jgi:hypothetical protein